MLLLIYPLVALSVLCTCNITDILYESNTSILPNAFPKVQSRNCIEIHLGKKVSPLDTLTGSTKPKTLASYKNLVARHGWVLSLNLDDLDKIFDTGNEILKEHCH